MKLLRKYMLDYQNKCLTCYWIVKYNFHKSIINKIAPAAPPEYSVRA